MSHPALIPSHVAVVTGGASGIGLAAARRFAALGLNVVIADLPGADLEGARRAIIAAADGRSVDVRAVPTDIGRAEEVENLKRTVVEAFGAVHVLMNNAGISPETGIFGPAENWAKLLDVNLWGVIRGTQAFVPDMVARDGPGLVINTGSKQGITTPPGNPAYNLSKAGVKVFTEQLEYELRNSTAGRITAHLLIPGFVFTGLTARGRQEKPAGAWTPDQTVDFMFRSIDAGDFYILCPDNEADRATDERRILWAAGDIVENRPPLSRWHPDFATAFAAYVATAKPDEGLQVAALNASNDD